MSRMKELREKYHYTQEEFGDLIGMSQQTVSRIENNMESVDVKTIKKISDFFHVSIDYLLGNIDTPWIIKDNEIHSQLQKYPHIYYLIKTSPSDTLLFLDDIAKSYIQREREKEECLISQ